MLWYYVKSEVGVFFVFLVLQAGTGLQDNGPDHETSPKIFIIKIICESSFICSSASELSDHMVTMESRIIYTPTEKSSRTINYQISFGNEVNPFMPATAKNYLFMVKSF